MISNQVLDYICDTHGHRITQWNHQILSQPLLQLYSDTVAIALDLLMGRFAQFAGLRNIRERSIMSAKEYML